MQDVEFDETGTRKDVSVAGTWMFFLLSLFCFAGSVIGLLLNFF